MSLIRSPASIADGDHACLFYSGSAAVNSAVTAYVTAGLQAGQRVFEMGDRLDQQVPAFRQALASHGVDLAAEQARGAFVTFPMSIEEFETTPVTAIAEICRDLLTQARADGYSGVRMSGEWDWSRVGGITEAAVDHEAGVDDAMAGIDAQILCRFDVAHATPAAMARLLSSHQVRVPSSVGPTLRVVRSDDHLVLEGELEITSAAEIETHLERAVADGIAVDLSGVTFADVAGLRALTQTQHESGRTVVLDQVPATILRTLDILGWNRSPGVEIVESAR